MKLVPYFLAINWDWGDHELFNRVEIGLIGICKVRVVLQEVVELVRLGLELAVLVFEHADRAARMDYQDLALVLAHHCAFVLLAGMDLLVEVDLSD